MGGGARWGAAPAGGDVTAEGWGGALSSGPWGGGRVCTGPPLARSLDSGGRCETPRRSACVASGSLRTWKGSRDLAHSPAFPCSYHEVDFPTSALRQETRQQLKVVRFSLQTC